MRVRTIDHMVLTVRDLDRTCEFYRAVVGLVVHTDEAGRRALRFGDQKINLHLAGHEFEPKAARPTPGSADVCFVIEDALADAVADLKAAGVEVEAGPVGRSGARGAMTSIYVRDPDGNLIELSSYRP